MRYESVDLGLPKGATGIEVQAASPNFRYVVGYASTNTPAAMRAFVWKNGTFHYLSSQDSVDSVAWAVNDAGQVVGAAIPNPITTCAIVWSRGKERRLFPGNDNCDAQGIDNAGNIYGNSIMPSAGGNAWRAYRRSPHGVTTYFDVAALESSFFHAANEKGRIALYLTDKIGQCKQSLLWDGKTTYDLPSPSRHCCMPRGINERGEVVGTYYSDSRTSIPLVWRHGKPSLIRLPKGFSGEALRITDGGDILGNASLQSLEYTPFLIRPSTYTDKNQYKETPFLIHEGTFYNLDDTLIKKTDIRRALQISRSGVILADGYVGKQRHGFLLNPAQSNSIQSSRNSGRGYTIAGE